MISIKFCFFSILKTYMSCAVVIFFYSIIWYDYISLYQTLCTCIIIILVSISFFIFHHIIFTICNLISANHIQDMQMMNILPPSQLIDLLSQHYHAVCIFLVYLVTGESIGIVTLENNLQTLTYKVRKTFDIFTVDWIVL